MFIVSQNEEAIVNLDNIDTLIIHEYQDRCEIAAFNGEQSTKLAEYPTKEMAKCIMNKIGSAYTTGIKTFVIMPNKEEVK